MKKLSLLLLLMLLVPLRVNATKAVNYTGMDTTGDTTYYAGKYGESFICVPNWYAHVTNDAYNVLISKDLHYNCKSGNTVWAYSNKRDEAIIDLYNANFTGLLSASFQRGLLPPYINTVDVELPLYTKVLQNSGYRAFYMTGERHEFSSSSTTYAMIYKLYDGGGYSTSTYYFNGTPHIALMVLFKGDNVLFLKEV